MVSSELLQELKVILLEDYGLRLSQKEISEVGNGLVDFFEVLAKVNDSKDYEYENNRNSNN